MDKETGRGLQKVIVRNEIQINKTPEKNKTFQSSNLNKHSAVNTENKFDRLQEATNNGNECHLERRDESYDDKNHSKSDNNIISSLEFIWSEIRSENVFENSSESNGFDEENLNNRIPKNYLNEVLQVPGKLESILNFSMLICLDTFLYDLTFLPINSIIALIKLLILSLLSVKDLVLFFITGKLKFDYYSNEKTSKASEIEFCNIKSESNIEINSLDFENDRLSENTSIEYIYEETQPKSKSLMNFSEFENKLRFRMNNKSKDDGFLGKNNNTLPQLKNYLHSYRVGDQKSSLEESELHSISASDDIFNDGINYFHYKENGLLKFFSLSAIELTDFSRFLVLLLTVLIFSRIDISFFYHYIRGQGLLKLYVIFNMLEIFEKLFRSFGRDLIDQYLDSTVELVSYFNFIDEYTMFLIVINNNFAEIKSTVFKTYNSISLFTIACSDAIERFQLLYDGVILFIRMYSNARLYTDSIYSSVVTWVISVYIVEIIVDWFKHSFLVKFNKLSSSNYQSYLSTLIGDVLISRGSNQAFEYLMMNYNRKNQENSSLDEAVRSSLNLSKFDSSNYSKKSNSVGNLTRQSTFSLLRCSTIGLEPDVSLIQNKDDPKLKKKKVKMRSSY
ncbi:Eukaryotic membrane protein [Cryptosporidium felis]|nr:Eukaryotic membrane protein [Cryptosporidium felis]